MILSLLVWLFTLLLRLYRNLPSSVADRLFDAVRMLRAIPVLVLQIIRRGGVEEKVLCVVKRRLHHTCPATWIVVALVAWEGVAPQLADNLYSSFVHKLNSYASPTERR